MPYDNPVWYERMLSEVLGRQINSQTQDAINYLAFLALNFLVIWILCKINKHWTIKKPV